MKQKLAVLILVLLQIGCGAFAPQATATPTQTATVTASPVPSSTPTPVPTATAPAPETVDVEAVGFTVSVPLNMDFDMNENVVGIFDQEGTFIVSFARSPYDSDSTSLQDVIDDYLNEVANQGGEFTQGESYPVTIGGAEGIAVDLTGKLFDSPIGGRVIAVTPTEDSVFFGLGVSNLAGDEKLWETRGAETFEALTDSVQFVDVQASGTCTVSTDTTYGYTETNPIRVGGDFLSGPARERAYLDNLLGPNGEALTYERLGSLPSGDTILDEYLVTGPGINVKLYLDEYIYEPLQAPAGFTCIGEFPLSAP